MVRNFTAAINAVKSKPLLFLFLLFILAFVLRAVLPDRSYFFWDEAIYLLHGRLFSGQGAGYYELFQRPPLLPLLLSPLSMLMSSGAYELASRLLVAFLNSFVVFPVYYLTNAVFGRKSAIVAAVVIAFLPVHIINSRWVMTDALAALLALSSVTAYFLGLKEKNRLLVFAGGVLAGLAVLMKFTSLLLVALLLPLLVLHLKARWRGIALSALLFVAVMLPYLVFNVLSFGSPFFTFDKAFHVVSEETGASLGFFLFLLKDSLGILAVFLAFGIAFGFFNLWRHYKSSYRKERLSDQVYMAYCFLVALAYSAFIVGRGISKPAGIEWEAGRFLLLFLLFAVPFIGFGISSLAGLFVSLLQRLSSASFAYVTFAVVAIVLVASAVSVDASLSLYPQFRRSYVPAIVYEDGLREVTKSMGVYLAATGINEFGCLGNCPPVSYYSGKKMSFYYDPAIRPSAVSDTYLVVFDGAVSKFSGNRDLMKAFCSGNHCVYLLRYQS